MSEFPGGPTPQTPSQDNPSAAPRKTALESRHLALGARMVDFAGWSMPLQYEGVVAEHLAVRRTCGLFDVSHMGSVFVRGADSPEFLQRTLTNDIGKAGPGRAQYTLLCNDRGGVVDDLIVCHLEVDEWLVVPNAANVTDVVAVLGDLAREASSAGEDVEVEDVSEGWGILALQGPRWEEVAADVLSHANPGRFRVERFRSACGDGIVSGTGYTGSPGIELLAPAATIIGLWDGMQAPLDAVGGMPAGLGARDTLRLEMGYPLHGHEISAEISPLEAGLDWVVALDSSDFPGSAALREQAAGGIGRELVGLRGRDRRPLRDGCPVRDAAGNEIGTITSGGYSPLLERGIGLALVRTGSVPATVALRGRVIDVEPVTPPFVDI